MNVYPHDTVVPFKKSAESKTRQVASMFDNIAQRYDFLNHFFSAGLDKSWRQKAIKLLEKANPQSILDVATGTADLAIMGAKIFPQAQITGIDISQHMLRLGREKIEKQQLSNRISLVNGDSEAILFPDHSFDAVTVGFGVRNFEHLEQGLNEIKRVLRPGGKLVILECTKPSLPVIKELFHFYMNYITPLIGKWISKDRNAYQYLNDSVSRFPEKENFIHILNKTGYRKAFYKTLTLGTCTIYCAEN